MSGLTKFSRVAIFSLAAVGISGVAPIAFHQLIGEKACPSLGPAPACYVVLLGYGLIAVSALLVGRNRLLAFLVGWIPLFMLALTGSGLEVLGQQACPRSSDGIPACFMSFALLALLAMFYGAERRHTSKQETRHGGA
jgi:hypothetical protein